MPSTTGEHIPVAKPIVEIYNINPENWLPYTTLPCRVYHPTDYRKTIIGILDVLIYRMAQYYSHLAEHTTETYSFLNIKRLDVFAEDKIYKVVKYTVRSTIDTDNGALASASLINGDFRPLFKEYQLFLIDCMLESDDQLVKEYYEVPFCIAVQRCVYIFLMAICDHFELSGRTPLKVYWTVSNPDEDHYKIYSCYINLMFDMTQNGTYPNSTAVNKLKLILTLPYDFKELEPVPKSRFSSDDDFYNYFWNLRVELIHSSIRSKFVKLPSLYCDEDISDLI